MDRLTALSLFVRIVDRGSFSAAAADLGISRPVATAAIKELEQRLGTRLLQRSTRHVQPTVEGVAYHQRCVAILADLEDADRGANGIVTGLLRVDVTGNLARTMLLPELPEFLALHPALTVHLGEGERFVDLVREGVDCIVRAGALADSGMTVRRLGFLEEITVASPGYLASHGVPTSPDDLGGHEMVGFVSSRTGQSLPLEFTRGDDVIEIALPARVLVGAARYERHGSAARARAYPGAALSLCRRPRERRVDRGARKPSADANPRVGALPEQPPAFPPRTRFHRLADRDARAALRFDPDPKANGWFREELMPLRALEQIETGPKRRA